MTIQLFRVVGVVALIGAGVVFGASLKQVIKEEPPHLDSQASIVEIFAKRAKAPGQIQQNSPLVKQAEVYAAYLKPMQIPQPKPLRIVARPVGPPQPAPVNQPPARPRFKVLATSYCAARPERSIALILESGGQDSGRRWVKEGTQIGDFTIQQILPGSIICRQLDSKQVREMAVEHGSQPGIVVLSRNSLARASEESVNGSLDVNLPLSEVP